MFDFVVVGAGPSGLTASYVLSSFGKKVLLIERYGMVGGLHRVNRINNLPVEHGPKIYSTSYLSFRKLLSHMGKTWDDFFVPLQIHPTDIPSQLQGLSAREVSILLYNFMKFLVDSSSFENQTVEEFSRQHNFSQSAMDVLDRICITTDGANMSRYTMYEFFNILNQNSLYGIYEPKYLNDSINSFLTLWKNKLIQQGVTIAFHTKVERLVANGNQITSLVCSQNNSLSIEIQASQYIFAVPPTDFLNLLESSNLLNAVPETFPFWVNQVKYNVYLPFALHWNSPLYLKEIFAKLASKSSQSPWGVAMLVPSNYWEDYKNLTIYATLTTLNKPSLVTGKTANQSSMQELQDEIWRYIQKEYPNLRKPDAIIPSPEIIRWKNEWISTDQSFVRTKFGFFGPQTNYHNLFWLNSGNGKSSYSFTSLESAVQNALSLTNQLLPESKKEFQVHNNYRTIANLFLVIILVIILIVFYYIYKH